jgi:L-alanine-DL-glutamate epimerase-like enolase superfamily enzyme
MPISAVDAFVLRYTEPNDFGAQRMTVLVRVTDRSGAVGWGEGIAMWPEACRATRMIVEEGLAPLVVGEEASDVVRLWHRMAQHLWWYGEGGIANFALSAIDMALWDLRGRIEGRSLCAMLGGRIVDKLPAIASTHPSRAGIEAGAQELGDYVAAGFRGVKFGFGKKGHAGLGVDPEHDARFIAAVREAVGPGPMIMADLGNAVRYDFAQVLALARRAEEEAQLFWIEEPFHPDDWDAHRALADRVGTRVAAGERDWSPAQYRRRLAHGGVAVFGIDPGRAMGVTGFAMTAEAVSAARRQVNAHAWSTAITSAASLQLSLCTPAALVFEYKPLPNPMQHDLVETPIDPVDGWAVPPKGPGLGVEVRQDIVDRYAVA